MAEEEAGLRETESPAIKAAMANKRHRDGTDDLLRVASSPLHLGEPFA